MIALLDGKLIPDGSLGAPGLSVLDRGFLYGDGIFETMRAYDGVIFALDEHLDRLDRSAIAFRMNLPQRPVLVADLDLALRTGTPARGAQDMVVRLVVSRGVAPIGMTIPPAPRLTRLVLVEPTRGPPPGTYDEGVACVSVRASSLPVGPLRGAKSTSYAGHVIATDIAREDGAHEAILVTDRAVVIEGASSSLFAFDGRECWAPTHRDALPSITRRHVILAAKAAGIRVHLRQMSLDALSSMREVMICSTIREVLSVTQLNRRSVGDGEVGPWAKRLRAVFRSH